MTNPFTNLEIQLIRSKLDTHSDGELAAILERSIEEINEFIDMMTVGGAAARSGLVQELKEAKYKELVELGKRRAKRPQGRAAVTSVEREKRIRERKEMLKLREENEIKKYQERTSMAKREVERRKEVSMRTLARSFKTRKVDYSEMKSVKVAKGTYVFVPKAMSSAEAVASYIKHNVQNKPEWIKKVQEGIR